MYINLNHAYWRHSLVVSYRRIIFTRVLLQLYLGASIKQKGRYVTSMARLVIQSELCLSKCRDCLYLCLMYLLLKIIPILQALYYLIGKQYSLDVQKTEMGPEPGFLVIGFQNLSFLEHNFFQHRLLESCNYINLKPTLSENIKESKITNQGTILSI